MWQSLWFQHTHTHTHTYTHTQTHRNIGVFLFFWVSCFIFEHNKDGLDTIIKAASEHRMTARVLDNQNHTVCISQSAVLLRLLLFLYSFYSQKVIAVLIITGCSDELNCHSIHLRSFVYRYITRCLIQIREPNSQTGRVSFLFLMNSVTFTPRPRCACETNIVAQNSGVFSVTPF